MTRAKRDGSERSVGQDGSLGLEASAVVEAGTLAFNLAKSIQAATFPLDRSKRKRTSLAIPSTIRAKR